MEKHKLDQLFSDKLSDLQAIPSVNAWEQIGTSLSENKKRSVWMWAGIAASAALAIFSSWYLLLDAPSENSASYAYSNQEVSVSNLPPVIVYVPIYIPTPVYTESNSVKETQQLAPTSTKKFVQVQSPSVSTEAILASAERPVQTEPEVIETGVVTMDTEKEIVLIASTADVASEEPIQQPPLTIIYKQGEPSKESNFTKAINYMEDVRLGEKKLVNFGKLRESFRAKFKSNKDINTK